MPKKKRKKYNFFDELIRIEKKKRDNLIRTLKEDQDLADAFLDDYAPKFPQLYRLFQAQLEGSVPGCIYIRLDKQKATQEEMPLDVYFASKSSLEEMLAKFQQHPGIKNILDNVSAWEKDRQQVPLGVHVGYSIKGTTFPVPVSEEIIVWLNLNLDNC